MLMQLLRVWSSGAPMQTHATWGWKVNLHNLHRDTVGKLPNCCKAYIAALLGQLRALMINSKAT